MKSTLELFSQYPGGFWACDDCDSELHDLLEGKGMEVMDLDIQYITDLSVTHCTRCDYAPETGLYPVQLVIV